MFKPVLVCRGQGWCCYIPSFTLHGRHPLYKFHYYSKRYRNTACFKKHSTSVCRLSAVTLQTVGLIQTDSWLMGNWLHTMKSHRYHTRHSTIPKPLVCRPVNVLQPVWWNACGINWHNSRTLCVKTTHQCILYQNALIVSCAATLIDTVQCKNLQAYKHHTVLPSPPFQAVFSLGRKKACCPLHGLLVHIRTTVTQNLGNRTTNVKVHRKLVRLLGIIMFRNNYSLWTDKIQFYRCTTYIVETIILI